MKFKRGFFFLIIFLALFGCKNSSNVKENETVQVKNNSNIKYAKRFAIRKENNYCFVYLFGNRQNYDTTSTFVIYTNTIDPNLFSRKEILIKSPSKRIAALSSIYATMFCELDAGENLVAIDNIDYVNNAYIIQKFNQGKLKELARTPQIDLEQTIVLNPEIIFTFGMGEGEKDRDKKLEQTGIPVAISIDHLEESPLARAEWIKFFAAFVGKDAEADSIFSAVEKNYFELQSIANKTHERPTVFNEIKYSDSWYMPGGKSYIAQLLNDAAADYLWKNNDRAGSLPLSFEQVFARARDADFWINLSTLKTKKELLGFESRYEEFKAYKTGNLYNNTKVTNSFGYSNYWETGMIYPNRILSDLIQIFHPELREQINRNFYYYEQLK
ncbi:ABC transporter substrate-binding protein [Aurantibacillus circumpalustris]|uniref:ABC transporter substrate-binding protein n=1 Tax=Aurantibacillus circumpalustris TaxID=3036359 RepID=UPI00295A9F6E|nr:ABC transporter substrate-binding protein [Aurantibacillus circumpalustris]